MKFKPNKNLFSLFAAGLIVLAVTIISLNFYFNWSSRQSVSAHSLPLPKQASKNLADPLITGQPIEISIPSASIDLPLINGYYDQKTRTWTLSNDKAQFAVLTAQPNNKQGNTFIYGHALNNVFGRLYMVKPGEGATVTTSNGYKFTYRFYSTYATQPTDLSVLSYKGVPIMTLQTCSGTWYQNRQMYLFSYVKYEKA